MLRRDFLKQTGAAAWPRRQLPARPRPALSCTPATRRSDKNPVIGQGEHRYECFHGWGEVPSSIRWIETHGVAVDKAGLHLHQASRRRPDPEISRRAQDTIVVFDPDGKFVRSFGKEYHGGGHGIDIREENGQEFLYLSCMMHGETGGQDRPERRSRLDQGGTRGAARLRQAEHSVRADQRGVCPRRRLLRRRRLRLELHPPVRQGRQVDPDLRRHGRRSRPVQDPARALAR